MGWDVTKFFLVITLFLSGIQLPVLASDKTSKSFERWKKSFINKAVKKGLPKKFLLKELGPLRYQEKIVKSDRNQVPFKKEIDYPSWIQRWLKPRKGTNLDRVAKGQALLKEHATVLNKVEKKYGVDKEAIVSLWGVETYYGQIKGKKNIIESLATLAFDKRRRKFFERELLAALKIVHEGHIKSSDWFGSWAGASGHCQFMPTSFVSYAQDFDGDGKKDIWNNLEDVFASIANYLKRAGWKKGQAVGHLILSQKAGRSLASENKSTLATIPFKNSPSIRRGKNYKSIMRWNRSSLFAALNIILIDGF